MILRGHLRPILSKPRIPPLIPLSASVGLFALTSDVMQRVFGGLSVAENLRLGGYPLKDEKQTQKNIDRVYERFPRLKKRRGQLVHTMSGGGQQMLAIGRALVPGPLMVAARFKIIQEPNAGASPCRWRSKTPTRR